MPPKSWKVPCYVTLADGVHCGHDHVSRAAARNCARNRLSRPGITGVLVVQVFQNGSRHPVETVAAQMA